MFRRSFSTFCFILVLGLTFTSPTYTVQYERQYSTIEIPWKFQNAEGLFSVFWLYKKRGSTANPIIIFFVNKEGKPVPDQVAQSNPFDGRIEFKGNFRNTIKDATLAIKNFMKDDEGSITCKVFADKKLPKTVTIRSIGI